MPSSYTSSAEFYDAIYTAMKDYAAEAREIADLVSKVSERPQESLLDIACGTGLHLEHFARMFDHVEGLDVSENQLAIAQARLPKIRFHQEDMQCFDLGKKFDAITCLFSAIGYAKGSEELKMTFLYMAKHLSPGGVVVVEPWILPEDWQDGIAHMQVVETDTLKLVRMNRSTSLGNKSVLKMHYLVLREGDDEPEYFKENHVLCMHDKEDYLVAMDSVGFNARFVTNDRRGYLVGVKRH